MIVQYKREGNSIVFVVLFLLLWSLLVTHTQRLGQKIVQYKREVHQVIKLLLLL